MVEIPHNYDDDDDELFYEIVDPLKCAMSYSEAATGGVL